MTGVDRGRAAGGAPLASGWLDAGGWRLHVRAAPGPAEPDPRRLPVVMIHGLGVSGRTLALLAPERAVLVPDLPGFGRSPAPRRPLDVAGLAAVVAAAMSAAGCEHAAVLGHSLGCQVAVELADRFPQRVGRLVLVAPTVDREARSAGAQTARLLCDSWREPPSLLALAAWDYVAAGPFRVLATLRFALADRMEIKLPWLEVPALVVRGGRDPLVSERWAEEVARRLPAGELRTFARAAHAVPYSSPGALAAAVGEFLDG